MPARREHGWEHDLDTGARIVVRWETERDVVRYAVLLLTGTPEAWRPVVLFDCSHEDRNDRHRYTRDGCKLPAEAFHQGSPGEGMRAATKLIFADHERMIDRWRL